MSYSPSSFWSPGLVVLLIAVSATLAYQNNELKNDLELAHNETNSFIALSKPPVSLLPAGQAERVFCQSGQSTAGNAEGQAFRPSSAASDLDQEPLKPATIDLQNEVSPVMTSLQDAFQKKTPADSQPISTVSPLGAGVWGAKAQ